MSIRDYNKSFLIINGTTNEQIKVEQLKRDTIASYEISTNEFLLLRSLINELQDNNTVTIIRTYAKD